MGGREGPPVSCAVSVHLGPPEVPVRGRAGRGDEDEGLFRRAPPNPVVLDSEGWVEAFLKGSEERCAHWLGCTVRRRDMGSLPPHQRVPHAVACRTVVLPQASCGYLQYSPPSELGLDHQHCPQMSPNVPHTVQPTVA